MGGCLVAQSCPTLATPWTVACQAPLSMGFCRQEYWRGLPFPSPRGSSRPRNRTQGSCIAGSLYQSGYEGSKGTGHLPNSKPQPTQMCIFYLKKCLEELAGWPGYPSIKKHLVLKDNLCSSRVIFTSCRLGRPCLKCLPVCTCSQTS